MNMKIKFYLQYPTNRESFILIGIYNGYKEIIEDKTGNKKTKYIKIQRSTGIKIKSANWKRNETVGKQEKNSIEINSRLADIKKYLLNLNDKYKQDNEPLSIEVLKHKIKQYINGVDTNTEVKTLLDYSEEYAGTKQKHHQKAIRQTIRLLKEFQKDKNYHIDFSTINMSFYNKFMPYMDKIGFKTNTKGKHIKNIKSLMNAAFDDNFHKNTEYRNKKFKVVTEKTIEIYLTKDELLKIHNLDLSKKPYLDNARDLFLVGAYIGQRYEDYSNLSEHNFYDNKVTLKQSKTKKTIIVPINKYLKSILDKRNGNPPKKISNQKLNEWIKIIGEMAGITNNILINNEVYLKFKMIKSHTARRSFITNAYLSGIPVPQIMKLSGHQTQQEFFKYLKIDELENADLLQGHEFFQ